MGPSQPPGDGDGLGLHVLEPVQCGVGAVRRGVFQIAGSHVAVVSGAEHRPRRGDDLWRGAVVLVEVENAGAREEVREALEQRRVRAVPTVDGLSRVPYDEEIVSGAEPCSQQPPLSWIQVLELVDEEVADAPVLSCGCFAVGLEQTGAVVEEVVESR